MKAITLLTVIILSVLPAAAQMLDASAVSTGAVDTSSSARGVRYQIGERGATPCLL